MNPIIVFLTAQKCIVGYTRKDDLIKMMHYIFTDSDEPETPPAIPHLSEARIELHHLIGKGRLWTGSEGKYTHVYQSSLKNQSLSY